MGEQQASLFSFFYYAALKVEFQGSRTGWIVG
jgi:hypothetical protein